jgi:hypothetical protein
MKARWSAILLYAAAAVTMLFGLRYATTTTLLAHHRAAIPDEVPPKVLALVLGNYRMIGAGLIALGLVVVVLAGRAARRDWRAWWAVSCSLVLLVTAFAVTFPLGPDAPWWVASIAITLVVVALVLAWLPP